MEELFRRLAAWYTSPGTTAQNLIVMTLNERSNEDPSSVGIRTGLVVDVWFAEGCRGCSEYWKPFMKPSGVSFPQITQ